MTTRVGLSHSLFFAERQRKKSSDNCSIPHAVLGLRKTLAPIAAEILFFCLRKSPSTALGMTKAIKKIAANSGTRAPKRANGRKQLAPKKLSKFTYKYYFIKIDLELIGKKK